MLWELVFEDGIASLTHYLDSMIKVRLQVGKNNEEKVQIFNDEVKNTDFFFTLDGIKKSI